MTRWAARSAASASWTAVRWWTVLGLRDLRVAEVVQQDLDLGADGDVSYRTKLRVSFKYEGSD